MLVYTRAGINNHHIYIYSRIVLEDFCILTTTHCLKNPRSPNVMIEAGVDYQSESAAIIRHVGQICIHSNYSTYSDFCVNDIDILHIFKSLDTVHDTSVLRACRPLMSKQ